jgi:hypothetical protein
MYFELRRVSPNHVRDSRMGVLAEFQSIWFVASSGSTSYNHAVGRRYRRFVLPLLMTGGFLSKGSL